MIAAMQCLGVEFERWFGRFKGPQTPIWVRNSFDSKLFLLRNSAHNPDVYDEVVLKIPAQSEGHVFVEANQGNLILVSPKHCCQIRMENISRGERVDITDISEELNVQKGLTGEAFQANLLVRGSRGEAFQANLLVRGSRGVSEKKLLQIFNHTQLGILVACFSRAFKQLRIVCKVQPNEYGEVSIPKEDYGNVIYCLTYVYSREASASVSASASASGHLYQYHCLSSHCSFVYNNRNTRLPPTIEIELISPQAGLWRQAWRPLTYLSGAGFQAPLQQNHVYQSTQVSKGPLQNHVYQSTQVSNRLQGNLKDINSNMTSAVWGNLPDEIFPLILVRLPFVSKIRARLVSKSWKEMLRHMKEALDDELWIVFRPFSEPCQIRKDLYYDGLKMNPPLFENRAWCPSSGLIFKFPFSQKFTCFIPEGLQGCLDRITRDYECMDLDEILKVKLTIELESQVIITNLKIVNFLNFKYGGVILKLRRNIWLEFEGPWCGNTNLQFLDVYIWNNKVVLVGALMRQSHLIWLRIWNLEKSGCGVLNWVEIAHLHPQHEMWKTLMGANSTSVHVEANICGCFVVVTCWIGQSDSTLPGAIPPIVFDLSKRYWRILPTRSLLHYVYNFSYKPNFEISYACKTLRFYF